MEILKRIGTTYTESRIHRAVHQPSAGGVRRRPVPSIHNQKHNDKVQEYPRQSWDETSSTRFCRVRGSETNHIKFFHRHRHFTLTKSRTGEIQITHPLLRSNDGLALVIFASSLHGSENGSACSRRRTCGRRTTTDKESTARCKWLLTNCSVPTPNGTHVTNLPASCHTIASG